MPIFHRTIDQRTDLQAPIERVFEVLTDHEGMRDWPGLADVRLTRAGEPRNGLGAIRRVWVRGLKLDEEVVRWEPPHGFDYQIIGGLPVDHLGSVRLSEHAGVTTIHWTIRMRSRVPFLCPLVLWYLGRGLPPALQHVGERARALDASAVASVPRCS